MYVADRDHRPQVKHFFESSLDPVGAFQSFSSFFKWGNREADHWAACRRLMDLSTHGNVKLRYREVMRGVPTFCR